jgi:hypothetical protein
VLPDVVADRLEQVRLAETRAPVDEERVVSLRRGLRDRECSGVGEPIRRADDEEVERVLGVEFDLAGFAMCNLLRNGCGNGRNGHRLGHG